MVSAAVQGKAKQRSRESTQQKARRVITLFQRIKAACDAASQSCWCAAVCLHAKWNRGCLQHLNPMQLSVRLHQMRRCHHSFQANVINILKFVPATSGSRQRQQHKNSNSNSRKGHTNRGRHCPARQNARNSQAQRLRRQRKGAKIARQRTR